VVSSRLGSDEGRNDSVGAIEGLHRREGESASATKIVKHIEMKLSRQRLNSVFVLSFQHVRKAVRQACRQQRNGNWLPTRESSQQLPVERNYWKAKLKPETDPLISAQAHIRGHLVRLRTKFQSPTKAKAPQTSTPASPREPQHTYLRASTSQNGVSVLPRSPGVAATLEAASRPTSARASSPFSTRAQSPAEEASYGTIEKQAGRASVKLHNKMEPPKDETKEQKIFRVR
jgi:hypothetical protein